ncbi:MAG TPA: hypothetical protein VHT96_14965 [Clostridia bacterium]|nr:hypothetical protein [Clostridia bacterium]
MKKCLLFRKLNSEKGAATVLVLCVTLILVSLGTIALFTSALNASLSGKVMNWTKEYYELDTQAEEYVKMIDQQLVAAENDARIYVRDRYDKKHSGELPSEFTGATYDMNSGPQAFFNGHFKDVWTKDTTSGAIEITLQDYLDDPALVQRFASYRGDTSLTTEQAFSADVEKYTDELFDRVYFFMLSKRLNALSGTVTPGDIVLKESEETGLCTDKFTVFGSTTWGDMAPNDGDIKLAVNVSNNSITDPKEVRAQISIVKPHYETILKTISTPVYGNPIWTNAITASGSVTFASGASAKIEGDVYAAGTGGISVEGGIPVEGDSGNIIRGNVYTQGDLAVTGSNGRLRVYSATTGSSGVSYDMKKLIYGNDYFMDTKQFYDTAGIDPGIQKWEQFFFKDLTDRGNVYCSNLLVKEDIQGADLKVDGNLWTKDDIQMDGRNSCISIGTTGTAIASGTAIVPHTSYIGLNPYSSENDPNSSSSVINNYPVNDNGTADSSIKINSNFVVPGVAFYEFDSGKTGEYRYYKSAESVSARTTSPTAIFYAYFYDGSGTLHDTFTSSENVDFDLITPTDEINNKRKALDNFFGTNSNIRTNITTDLTEPDGYVAGVALIQHGGGADADLYTSVSSGSASVTPSGILLPGSTQYLSKYSELISAKDGTNALLAAFDYKTKQLGKADGGNFDDFLDTAVTTGLSEIIKPDPVSGVRTLNLPSASITEGIVYSDGDLTISGDGVFRGTVICRGNVTIEGRPTIIYDEGVISNKLMTYKNVRDFFAKGNTGSVIGTINDYSSTSGERTVLKRYRILSWQEKSPAP